MNDECLLNCRRKSSKVSASYNDGSQRSYTRMAIYSTSVQYHALPRGAQEKDLRRSSGTWDHVRPSPTESNSTPGNTLYHILYKRI